jgi:hypothetical protein
MVMGEESHIVFMYRAKKKKQKGEKYFSQFLSFWLWVCFEII